MRISVRLAVACAAFALVAAPAFSGRSVAGPLEDLQAEVAALRKENALLRERARLAKENTAIRERLAGPGPSSALASAAGPADMPTKAPVSAPLSAPLAAPAWTGFYAGANVGFGWGDNAATVTANDPATGFFSALIDSGSIHPPRFDTNGVFGGLQIGYNQQFAVNWLAGIETDIQWSNIKGGSHGAFEASPVFLTNSASEHVHWFGTVRGRLGYLVTPNWLLYGTGGYAYGRVEHEASITKLGAGPFGWVAGGVTLQCTGNAVCAAGSRTDIRSGWTAGGGFEYMLTGDTLFAHPVTLKLEYLYVNLGSDHLLVPSVNNPTAASFTAHFGDVALHTVRGGVNVKF